MKRGRYPRSTSQGGSYEDSPDEVVDFRLSRDLKKAAQELTQGQARYLVDFYYQLQDFRIQAEHQQRTAEAAQEPAAFVGWLAGSAKQWEAAIRRALDVYSDQQLAGRWAKSQVGIGPVLAAGLLAHVTPANIPTAGKLWAFAGLAPGQVWGKGQKRPWNARLKVLCWKIGESFVKQSGRPDCFYGRLWAVRKQLEIERNERGEFAEQARLALTVKRFGEDTVARQWYSQGKLPPAHLHARAKRWAVKLFLAHYQHVAWQAEFGTPPPKPYVISVLGHGDYIGPPNWPMQE